MMQKTRLQRDKDAARMTRALNRGRDILYTSDYLAGTIGIGRNRNIHGEEEQYLHEVIQTLVDRGVLSPTSCGCYRTKGKQKNYK